MPPYIATTLPVVGSMEAPPARTYWSALRSSLVSLYMTLSSTALTKAFCFGFSSVVVMR